MIISRAKAPGWFLPVGLLFLAWNIVGDIAYYMQVTADLTEMAKTDAYTAKTFAEMPTWAWSCYAVAVWGATLASVLLLLKRGLAVLFYALSLLAVIGQFSYSLLMTDLIAVKGLVTAAAFPAFIFVMGVVELLFARDMKEEGRHRLTASAIVRQCPPRSKYCCHG